MTMSHASSAISRLVLADAATCAAMGAALTLWSGPIGQFARIPPALLFYAGLILFPIAVFMAVVATRPAIPAAGVWLIILGNIAWVAASLLLLVSGWIEPNALGTAFVAAQAVVVAVLAKLEHGAWRAAGPRLGAA